MSDTGSTTTTTPGGELGGLGSGGGFNPQGAPSGTTKTKQAIGVAGQKVIDVKTGKTTYEGYQAPSATAKTASAMGVPFVPNLPKIEPRYFEEDVDSLGSMSRGYIASWQMKLNSAGLLGNNFALGVADNSTVSAYREVLGVANREGITDKEALDLLMQRKIDLKAGTGVTKYRLSNPGDIRAVIDQASQSLLGRQLDEGQINRMVQMFQQQELAFQKNYAAGGQVQEAPSAQTFAASQIQKDFGDQVDLRKLDTVFGAVNDALMRGK